jgi:hypothetical protein
MDFTHTSKSRPFSIGPILKSTSFGLRKAAS